MLKPFTFNLLFGYQRYQFVIDAVDELSVLDCLNYSTRGYHWQETEKAKLVYVRVV